MRMARSTGALSGALIVLLGLWGALVPFIGPYFDYSFSANSTWHFTLDRLWLCVLPGAFAVVGGVLLLFAATRLAGVIGGWLAVLGGAWFAIGPAVSLTWESGPGPIGRPLFGPTRQMLELIGYFYGLGALIIALAAFSIGRFASRPALAEQAAIAGAGPADPLQGAQPVPHAEPARPAQPAPAAAEARSPQGRRFGFRRRERAHEQAAQEQRPRTPAER